MNLPPKTEADRDLEAIKLFTQRFKNLESAENRDRQENGGQPLESLDDLADLMNEVVQDLMREEGNALTPQRLETWKQRLENSPALEVLRRIAGRVNDELLEPGNTVERSNKLEFIKDQSQDASILMVQLRSAMGLPVLRGDWYVEPDESNTPPALMADIDKLFEETR